MYRLCVRVLIQLNIKSDYHSSWILLIFEPPALIVQTIPSCRLTLDTFNYYTTIEADSRRVSCAKVVILMLKKMMLLDDDRVSCLNIFEVLQSIQFIFYSIPLLDYVRVRKVFSKFLQYEFTN